MAYLHCVPAVSLDEQFSPRFKNGGMSSYHHGMRRHRPLAVVELSMASQEPAGNKRRGRRLQHKERQSKDFPLSCSSRVKQQNNKLAGRSMTAPEKHNQKHFAGATNKLRMDDKGRQKTSKSVGSVSVDRVYKPTLPKYCFSASTYQSVLTDYSCSSDLGLLSDLSELPPPRHTLMTRELPYVYRYKIQQGITSLNNMIPTKRSPSINHIW